MLNISQYMCERKKQIRLHHITAITVSVGFLLCAGIASAAEAVGSQEQIRPFPAAQIFTFLFLMLGPFKIIGPFAAITKGADVTLTRKIALQATFFSSIALLLAAFIGERSLSSYGIPVPILALSAGVILFLVALLNILKQFIPSATDDEDNGGVGQTPTLKMALSPLAFPTIVTPYGIATLVVFLALSPTQQGQLTVGAIVLAIMLLNLIVMLVERRIMAVLALVLPILGAVLGIIQVALGLQIMHNSLKALGLL